MKSKVAALVIAMAVGALAAGTVGHAASEGKGTGDKKEVAGQQLCPATPGGGVCQVNGDGCCSTQTPGQTACQAPSDCPPAKPSVKAKKESKKSD
ncbi:MAG: hypothetical protein WBV23_09310 [Desulfobaccales bacterium]